MVKHTEGQSFFKRVNGTPKYFWFDSEGNPDSEFTMVSFRGQAERVEVHRATTAEARQALCLRTYATLAQSSKTQATVNAEHLSFLADCRKATQEAVELRRKKMAPRITKAVKTATKSLSQFTAPAPADCGWEEASDDDGAGDGDPLHPDNVQENVDLVQGAESGTPPVPAGRRGRKKSDLSLGS
eukprot:TRINITY_DN73019_c0_g1_i1.p1 TRINITY_DN73019_c0_g1~~TRINITY_DN73019_c0_g1_i1.p1  ORF type:complete len:185 (+),score=15.36 TRINITY_DN73019_c0_g1_i1:84-638(+)